MGVFEFLKNGLFEVSFGRLTYFKKVSKFFMEVMFSEVLGNSWFGSAL